MKTEIYPRTERIKRGRIERNQFVANEKLKQASQDFRQFAKQRITHRIAASMIYEACKAVRESGPLDTPEHVPTVGDGPQMAKEWDDRQSAFTQPNRTPEEITEILEREFAAEKKEVFRYQKVGKRFDSLKDL